MGIKKMSLATIQGKLSRAEMKNIMAGSGSDKNYGTCCNGSDCYPKTGCSNWSPCNYTFKAC
jgi:hypothetical protein